MKFVKSIGWKITIWHSIMFILILFVFSGILYITFSDMLTKKVDAMLARELGLIIYCLEKEDPFSEIEDHVNRLPGFSRVNEEEIYWQIENEQGTIIAGSHNLHRKHIRRSGELEKVDEHVYVWSTELNGTPLRAMSASMTSNGTVNYQITVATYSRILNLSILNLKHILLCFICGFVVISIAIGRFISQKTLQPIHRIINTANQITATNLYERLPIEGPEDELQSLSKTLNCMIDRLEASFSQIQQFTSDVSHELRTSLTIMRGELDVALHRSRSAEEYEHVLHTVLEEVIYLSDMVEKFLYLSRSASDSNQIAKKRVDGAALFQYVNNHVASLIVNKQIALHIETPDSFSLYGDEDLLRRLFINLLENAIKYSPTGGIVTIQARNHDACTEVEVIDHGIGIPVEHLPFIFQRFYRVDDARSRSEGGTGLGLSLCKSIVEAHNGTIEVWSQPDNGTRVTVRLLADTSDV